MSAALVGAACGAQTLVRAELILFVPALLVPGVLLVPRLPLRKRFGLLAVGLVATTVVIAPWVGRNLATFKDPTYLSSGEGLALSGANCAQTYSGPGLGSWNLACATAISGSDESVQSALDQHAAFEYATHHADRLPEVVLARIGRLWDFYQPNQMATVDVNEGRPRPAALWGLGIYYAMLPLAVSGIVMYPPSPDRPVVSPRAGRRHDNCERPRVRDSPLPSTVRGMSRRAGGPATGTARRAAQRTPATSRSARSRRERQGRVRWCHPIDQRARNPRPAGHNPRVASAVLPAPPHRRIHVWGDPLN